MPVMRRSLSGIAVLAAGCLLLAGRVASAQAQYTVQVLPPPADLPTAITRGFAINNSGQVLGYAVVPFVETRAVLWTDGVPQSLTFPAGYTLTGETGHQFLNDSGRVVLAVVPEAGPQYAYRTVYWDDPASPHIVPAAPNTCGAAGGVAQELPWGLNNAGHVLIGSYICSTLWRWDGGDEFDFHDLVSLSPSGPGLCADIYRLRANQSHLNDADHVALELGSLDTLCPTYTNATGILVGTSFTPIMDVPNGGGATYINSHDQLLVDVLASTKYWDGSTIVDLGFVSASLNDLSEVVFWDHGVPKLYKDGVITDLVLPPVPDAFSSGGGSILNEVGQLLSGAFIGPPLGPVVERAIVFTPRKPVITWPKPADIVYGTALSATQLNATANVPGTFTYNPPAGTVLSAAAIQLLSVTFTPNDLVKYDPTNASNSIGVLSTPLTVTADNANKVFGEALPSLTASFIGFVNGDGPGNLAGSLSLTTGATSTSPAGSYSIVPGGVSSPNYIISFVNGTLTIAPAATTTAVQALPTTTGELQPVILIATVVPVAPGAGAVDGTLQFKDGASLLGTATVTNGLAYLLVNGLTPGIHTITAAYAGTGNFNASTSNGLAVTIQPALNSSFTLMFPLTQPQVIGQAAVYVAVVIGLGGGPVPSGTVQFTEGNTVRGSAALNAQGIALFSTPALPAGVHLLGARYVGAGSYAASTASPIAQTIYSGASRPATTGITLTTSSNPSTVDQPLMFTATVTGGATAGDVYFLVDGFPLGLAPLTSTGGTSRATFTLNGLLSTGSHVIAAFYAGSPGFAASTTLVPAVQMIQLPGTSSPDSASGAAKLFEAAAKRAMGK